MIELKTAAEIDKMAVTGEFVAETLATLAIEAQPGVNLMQLEHHARTLVSDRGATILLLGLRAVIRSRSIPQRHLPIGQRCRAPWDATRLRAG